MQLVKNLLEKQTYMNQSFVIFYFKQMIDIKFLILNLIFNGVRDVF